MRKKIKNESWQLVIKQKSYSRSNNVKKMPKKLKIVSLKIHKGAEIFKNPKTFLNKVTEEKKII